MGPPHPRERTQHSSAVLAASRYDLSASCVIPRNSLSTARLCRAMASTGPSTPVPRIAASWWRRRQAASAAERASLWRLSWESTAQRLRSVPAGFSGHGVRPSTRRAAWIIFSAVRSCGAQRGRREGRRVVGYSGAEGCCDGDLLWPSVAFMGKHGQGCSAHHNGATSIIIAGVPSSRAFFVRL